MSAITPAVELVVAVAGVVMTLVAPLYYLVLDMREDLGAAGAERQNVSDVADDLGEKFDDIQGQLVEVRREVNEISVRSEMNQKHIHDLILTHDENEGGPLTGAPHPESDCPFDGDCPWHGTV